MSKRLIVGMLVFSVALAAWAGDPWRSKPYQQWDEKDVRKIMFDSPWVQVVTVDETVPGEYGGSAPGRLMSPEDVWGPGGSQRNRDAAQGPRTRFLIRWFSARVIREAIARDAVLSGKVQNADAQKALAEPVAEYQILLAGADMGPFTRVDEKTLAVNASLRAAKSKEKMVASRVEIQRGSSGKKVLAILFAFPKKDANGEATISAGEKGVEFECHTEKLFLRAYFDTQRMVDGQGPDL